MRARKPSIIHLHIGTEKTGTTTLQALASTNRTLLAKHGLYYPVTPGDPNHIGLTVFARDQDSGQELNAALKLHDAAAVSAYRETFLAKLQAELREAGQDRVLMSNEHLSSRLRHPVSIDRLVRGLRGMADTVRVIIYLRPQHELVLSAYSTSIKSGNTTPIRFDQGENNFFFNYDKMLSLWENALGIENIDVRVFSKEKFHGGDLVSDFFHVLGMPPPPGLVVPEDRNRALDAETVEFLRLANEIYPRFVDGKLSRERVRMLAILEDMSTGPRITAPTESLSRLEAIFRDSNERVASRYFADLDGSLFPPLKARGNDDQVALTPQRAVELAVALWKGRQRPI